MILVMLSPILIILFIVMGIFEERRRNKSVRNSKIKLYPNSNKDHHQKMENLPLDIIK